MSEILPSSGWALGQVKCPKTYLTYDVTHKKTFFFIADSKTCRLFWGFKQLSSTTAWWVMQ